MKREMVDVIVEMGERNRFSKGIFGWIGFRTYWYAFENVERAAGETKWNFWKLFKYSIDGIISFSQMPLNIASWMGVAYRHFPACHSLYRRKKAYFWRCCAGLGIQYVRDDFYRRNTIVLPWRYWAVHRQDLCGDEEAAALYCQRVQR